MSDKHIDENDPADARIRIAAYQVIFGLAKIMCWSRDETVGGEHVNEGIQIASRGLSEVLRILAPSSEEPPR